MFRLLISVFVITLFGCSLVASAEPGSNSSTEGADTGFRLILVRHAEKQKGSNPALTTFGTARAEFFAGWLENENIRQIWSSDYNRTRDTAAPLAEQLELELRYYDPGNLKEFLKQLLENKENAFVVGHSNTTPELASLLCDCEVPTMDDKQYDLAYETSINNGEVVLSEINLRTLWLDRP